jgi:hypothetical protein
MQDNSRSDAQILSADELRALRERAVVQKQVSDSVPDRPPNADDPPG